MMVAVASLIIAARDTSTSSSVVDQAITLIRMVGREKILTCDCDRKFVRSGKRLHCSERCQKRVYMRRYRY